MSTPFSRKHLEDSKISALKLIKSVQENVIIIPYSDLYQKTKKPTIMGTGMNNISSNPKAVTIFKKNNLSFTALMHTTNLYPTPDKINKTWGNEKLR